MRFERQVSISSIGQSGQQKIALSHVTVIGAGGLGCPVLIALAAAGIKSFTVIDFDVVSLSNLNRQVLYGVDDIGKPKASLAAQKLSLQYKNLSFEPITTALTTKNISELIKKDTIIIDCVDNIKTRMIVNDYAVSNDIPYIEGGINGFYGFAITIFKKSPCLSCIGFQNTPEQKNISALATTAGIIGNIMANEAIKIITGSGSLLTGKLLQYDGLSGSFDTIEINSVCNCYN